MIPEREYAAILERIPILCVDIVIRNGQGRYLLVCRRNEPLKCQWWVVGGRVLKGETIEAAARRKVQEEVSLTASHLQPIGYYEGFFDKHPFATESPLHTVSVVFSTDIEDHDVALDSQSSEWRYDARLPADFVVHPFGGTTGR